MCASEAVAGMLPESTCVRHNLGQVDANRCEEDEEEGKHDKCVGYVEILSLLIQCF